MGFDKYKYKFEMSYVDTTKLVAININSENIRSIIIDRDYKDANMPVMVANLSLDRNLIDDMILNSNKNLINVTCYKYICNSDMGSIKELYFREQFAYIMTEDLNYNADIDYAKDNADRKDLIKDISIGLMKIENINKNKQTSNMVLKNTTMMGAISMVTSHLPMLIEKFDYNKTISQLVIPPLTSVAKTIAYLNNVAVFYSRKYRFFIDYDCTYLLSSKGISVSKSGDNMKSVLLVVSKPNDHSSNVEGIYTNTAQKNYQINVNAKDTEVSIDKVREKSFTNITGVGSSGMTGEQDLDINVSDYSTNKTELTRIPNENTNMMSNIKSDKESSSVKVYINKDGIDTSVLTLNKEYIIKNYDKHSDKDGRFLLNRKLEIFMAEDDSFALSTSLYFEIVK